MAISHNRPDPSSPSAVAAAGFTTSRRGFDQNEVREFLRMVAAEIARLQEREAFLERELHTAQRAAAGTNVVLDDDLVTKMLGEEATRLLQTAREGAAQIKARAEEGAARLLREATDEAQRVREEAELEAARKRSDAAADAEAELQMAKQQGRDMVKEAQDYRERVLSELGRRRELARQQIEQLGHGRDRLLQAFERARVVALDVMAELTPLGPPEEYVNLAVTTGPVPLMVPSNAVPTRVEATPALAPAPEAADEDATVALARPDAQGPAVESAAVDEDAAARDVLEPDEAFEMVAVVDVVDVEGETQRYDLSSTIERLRDVDEAWTAVEPDGPAPDGPGSQDAAAQEAAGHEDAAEEPSAEEPSAEEPSAEEPSAEEPSAEEPSAEQPSAEDVPQGALADEVVADAPPAHDVAPEGSEQPAAEPPTAISRVDISPAEDTHDDVEDHREPAPVVSLFGGGDRSRAEKPAKPSVDELFAKLRASRTDQVARRASESASADVQQVDAVTVAPAPAETPVTPDAPLTPPTADAPGQFAPPVAREDSVFLATPDAPPVAASVDDSPFARRDEALTPIIVGAARRLKRVLADEQNEVLHVLRRSDPVRTIDALVPPLAEHGSRYGASIEGDLLDAALAGAASMGADAGDVRREFVRSSITRPAHDVVAAELVRPLRDRLDRALIDADGDNGELTNLVRTIYREWKNQRIDEQLDDIVQMAYGRGALGAAAPGSPIRWIVDPNGPACPDAEDNALAGVVAAGEPFPTDHTCAPAHRGCRCMVVPAT